MGVALDVMAEPREAGFLIWHHTEKWNKNKAA
jgi:hypothetical protein